MIVEGFVLRARYTGDDSEFRGVQQSTDTQVDIQMRRQMQLLSGTWTGSWAYVPAGAAQRLEQMPQMQLTQDASHLSGGATPSPLASGFDGTIRDAPAIGSTMPITGTIRMYDLQAAGRQTIAQCLGTGTFAGTVNWEQLTITAPQVVFPCASPYTDVTLSLVRQH